METLTESQKHIAVLYFLTKQALMYRDIINVKLLPQTGFQKTVRPALRENIAEYFESDYHHAINCIIQYIEHNDLRFDTVDADLLDENHNLDRLLDNLNNQLSDIFGMRINN